MSLPELCIRRPVFATVLSLIVLLLGMITYDRLSVREYPNIDEPVVTVETTYPGATAEIMETQVTQPLEDSLAGIEGIDLITSISREETSQITIKFKIDRNVDLAANDVRDRVGRARDFLPDEIEEPVIAKVEADAQPIIYLAFSSDKHTPLEVTDYADRYVKDRLQTMTGVANVMIFGERRYAMRVWLDKQRLAAYNLTPQDVETALRQQNIEVPAGRIESADREFSVLSETDLRTVGQFEQMIVHQAAGGYLVRLKDVARIELGAEDVRRISRFNGDSAIALGIVKQSVANPLDVSKALYEELPIIRDSLPEGMKVDVAYDSSLFIDRSIKAVYSTIFEATLLVVLVIFFFLRTLRASVIPLVTIPVSLIGAFTIMYILGFSVNTLTLLAMVLAIGLVVDDAIVMLENIFRHVEAGMHPVRAAMKGAKEITFAVIAMTLTLAAVYAPIGFMEGRTGRLFTEFALTLAGAVLVSGFVALTLTPMMCSRLLKHEEKHGRFYNAVEGFLNKMTEGYRNLLTACMKVRPLVLLVGVVVSTVGIGLGAFLPSELSPTEDRGVIIGIGVGPEGATVDYTDRYMAMMENFYKQVPEVEKYFVIAGFPTVSQIISFVRIYDWADRSRSQQDIAAELAPKMFGGIPGIMAFPVSPPSLGQRPGDKPVQLVMQSSATYHEMQGWVNSVLNRVRTDMPGLAAVDTDLRLDKPQLKIDVDREKAADLGIDVAVIGRTLETLLGSRQVTRFKREGKQYDVIVQVDDAERTTPSEISGIYVRAVSGEMVPLENLVKIVETTAPKELNHFNKLRAVKITANLNPGASLGEELAKLADIVREVSPSSVLIDYDGQSREFLESSASLFVTFFLALAFIYLVLAAQFESFKDPFIIMLTVPLSIAGALVALWLTNGSLNVYSQIGLVTLIGLITKNGILIVEFANQLQENEGKHRVEAAVESAQMRLRPILMTSLAMILGAIPLALATGAGAESRSSIGWVIVGGMTIGTFFTLFVIPVVYTYMARRKWAKDPNFEDEQPQPSL